MVVRTPDCESTYFGTLRNRIHAESQISGSHKMLSVVNLFTS